MRDENAKSVPPTTFGIISGWKDIARYLGKGVRTVQRYERELGLPVRRPAGKKAGAVVAFQAELDGWIAASPFRHAFLLNQDHRDVKKNTSLALKELRALTAETHRLRSESIALRESHRLSWEMLRSNLQVAMTKTNPSPPIHPSTLSADERRVIADVLPFKPTKKKIS